MLGLLADAARRERMIEDETWDPAADLLRLSRVRRAAELRAADDHIAAYVAGRRWGIYQLLGKLCPTVYLWQKDA